MTKNQNLRKFSIRRDSELEAFTVTLGLRDAVFVG